MENEKHTKEIFLTFDDGPNEPHTSRVLDILKHYNAHASFFVCGKSALRFPRTIRRIVDEGHTLGNHSFSHSRWRWYFGFPGDEITHTDTVIQQITGRKPLLFRPPWGMAWPWVRKKSAETGHKLMLWTRYAYAFDWWRPPAEYIAKRIIRLARPGSIILLHDGSHTQKYADRSHTVQALPTILETLLRKGYAFERLPEG